MRRGMYYLVICCLVMSSHAVMASSAMSIGVGTGTKDIQGYRVNFVRSWANDGRTPNKRRLTGYWELGFTQMHNPITYSFPTTNNNDVTSLSVVLRVPFKLCLQWYFDIGVGLAYLTNREIATRDLGTKWLFEDRIGIGFLLGKCRQYEVGYRLVHFSNGYLAQTNQGVNLHLLILGYWF